MRPINWLEEILGTTSRVRVLRLLSRDVKRSWTGRELARATGLSPNTVALTLHRFRERSILSVHRYGRTNVVRLRGDHDVTRTIAQIFRMESRLEDRYLAAVRKAVPRGVACYMFGSAARGEATWTSDVDLLVVAPSKMRAEATAERIRRAATNVLPGRMGILALNAQEARRRARTGLFRSILAEGVSLGDRPLEDFL